jgi:tRNA-dihydrouridine synthase
MKIRDLVIDPPVLLAPMAGLTHLPFRAVVADTGGAGLFFSEMLSARALSGPTTKDHWLLATDRVARPFFFQLFAADPADIPPAIDRLLMLAPDGIDLNLACPAPRVRKRGAGGSLGADPLRAAAVVAAARGRMPPPLPLTCKVRLPNPGSGASLAELLSMLHGAGADGVTIHARYPGDGRDRPARWGEIAGAKGVFPGAVIVNGGITSVADARKALAESGADGAMIARGALADPALGARIASALAGLPEQPLPSRGELLVRLCDGLRDFFPERIALRSLRLHLLYAEPWIPFGHHLWKLTTQAKSFDEAVEAVRGFFEG